MTKTILVDDEPLAIKVLSEQLKKFKEMEILKTYTNPKEALVELQDVKPDVIFLDMEMGKYHGLKMAAKFKKVNPNVHIIFVTAHSEFALNAFEVDAMDYLLKPVSHARLKKAIKRIDANKKEVKPNHYIQSFGSFVLFDPDKNPIKWRTNKTKELFALLWSQQGKVIDRDYLIETLFPDRDDADKTGALFSTTMYQLRQLLKKTFDDEIIVPANKGYIINTDIDSDVKKLTSFINDMACSGENFKEFKDLYQFKFLQFEDYEWAENYRTEYNNLVMNCIISHINAQKEFSPIDPFLEDMILFLYSLDKTNDHVIHRAIQYYHETQQTLKLNKFYEDHVQYLKEEMDLDFIPSLEELIHN